MTDIKKSRLTEEQIIGFLKQDEARMPIKELVPQSRVQRCDVLQVAFLVRRQTLRQAPSKKPN